MVTRRMFHGERPIGEIERIEISMEVARTFEEWERKPMAEAITLAEKYREDLAEGLRTAETEPVLRRFHRLRIEFDAHFEKMKLSSGIPYHR